MSSETAISTIETVKKKLQKYNASKQHEKVEEYLHKLQSALMTPELFQATKIDVLVGQLASNKTASYNITAQNLLKKWSHKNVPSKTLDTSKVKTVTNTKKLPIKRKSDHDDTTDSYTSNQSQQSNDSKTDDRNQSSSIKKRKVLSFAEYLGSKKPIIPTSSSNIDPIENHITDTEAQKIYAEFDAKCKELVAKVPDLVNNVDKKLRQNDINVNSHLVKKPIAEEQINKHDDLWAEDDDDDDDINLNAHSKEETIKSTQSIKTKHTSNSESRTSQKVKNPLSKVPTKIEDHLMAAGVGSTVNSVGHSQVSKSWPTNNQRKPGKSIETVNFLRSKQTRQAIYSGTRTRTNRLNEIPSLQDLCVETLKDYVDDICHLHFCRLPFEIVKPIIDAATPEQLDHIIDNNPDYADDVEPIWQQFCALHFKDAQRDECETYYELYLRKSKEQEARLQHITEIAKRKRAETVDTTRQTKSIMMPPINRVNNNSNKSSRQLVNLPSSKPFRGQPKTKKPAITPLLKKTLKVYQGKS